MAKRLAAAVGLDEEYAMKQRAGLADVGILLKHFDDLADCLQALKARTYDVLLLHGGMVVDTPSLPNDVTPEVLGVSERFMLNRERASVHAGHLIVALREADLDLTTWNTNPRNVPLVVVSISPADWAHLMCDPFMPICVFSPRGSVPLPRMLERLLSAADVTCECERWLGMQGLGSRPRLP